MYHSIALFPWQGGEGVSTLLTHPSLYLVHVPRLPQISLQTSSVPNSYVLLFVFFLGFSREQLPHLSS